MPEIISSVMFSIIIVGGSIFIGFIFYKLFDEMTDGITAMIAFFAATIISFILIIFTAIYLGENDYEIYLADEKTLCSIDGVKPYGQDGGTYYYILKDENGKHKYYIDSEFVYIAENEDTPILKTYERKYNKHWYTITPYDGEIDHYELYIPETGTVRENENW